MVFFLAESVRFELTVGRPITSFQDWLLKPLGQLSMDKMIAFSLPKVKPELFLALDKHGKLC